MSKHRGSCHCGAVRFSVELDELKELISCNCSMCKRAGWMLTFVPSSSFHLEQGEDKLTDYQFAQEKMHHTFCSICGVRPFTQGPPHEGVISYAVNTNCLTDFDSSDLVIKYYDGASL